MYAVFTTLEKTYDKVIRKALGEVLTLYGMHGRILNVKSFDNGSRVCESKWC